MKINGVEPVNACVRPEECGQRRDVGHPRAGWIQVRRFGRPGPWFCSWSCLTTYAALMAVLGGETGAPPREIGPNAAEEVPDVAAVPGG